MLSKRQVFTVLFSISILSFYSHSIKPYYNQSYFSDREVFRIIENNDERRFAEWLRTYPDVNIRNHHGQTPLMIAARLQNRFFVERLLEAGALRYLVDNYGKTARDYALQAEANNNSSSVIEEVATAVVAGAAIGLCAYTLYSLFNHDISVVPVVVPVSNSRYHDPYYNHCNVCNHYVRYTHDPLKLYCSSCYDHYNQRYDRNCRHNQYHDSVRLSDYL